ncbi:hypothetical protein F5B19DRAFT_283192 [Rostrohypoxylon terebratum]|nr:hypothetical protein F5B19DRAFT_283192 [Rostrohypoxylon terebratum]
MSKCTQISDSRYVCSLHGLVVCFACELDFSVYDYLIRLPKHELESILHTLEPGFRYSLASTLDILGRDKSPEPPPRSSSTPPELPALSDPNDPRTEWLIPQMFVPPSWGALPSDLFREISSPWSKGTTYFVRRSDPKQLLIFAGAIRVWKESRDPQAGWVL